MGLNLNYTPNRLVDITTLTEDQWLSWRRKGIGGSDVAVALNSSPYRTARDLYYDKIGVVMSDDGPDRSITFQIGHLLEDVVAQIFAKKTGLSVYEDHWMYQHPFFPFLIADVDRFVTLPDGRKAILECKTAHYDMQFKWANGAVPRHYELQVRHYMSVMNIDVAFIACSQIMRMTLYGKRLSVTSRKKRTRSWSCRHSGIITSWLVWSRLWSKSQMRFWSLFVAISALLTSLNRL